MINLISDTVTQPSKEMLKFMIEAETGDDVFQEDPTVIKLEKQLSSSFGKEDGLFCPSGTMANQIAIKALTQPLDELICEINSHVFQFEVGGYSFHSQIAIQPIVSQTGKLNPELIVNHIRPSNDWFPNSRLVVLENTGNRTGGNYYDLLEMQSIHQICKQNGLSLHLDGARIFNAMVEAGYAPGEVGPLFDTLSICLSKGLGAPVGSVLVGSKELIQRARKIRKVMGGGMRQSGLLAAAGLFALEHNVQRLKEDHRRAKEIESTLLNCAYVAEVKKVYTNIIIFNLIETFPAKDFIGLLTAKGIRASAFGSHSVRMVTHLDISDEMIAETCQVLKDEIKFP